MTRKLSLLFVTSLLFALFSFLPSLSSASAITELQQNVDLVEGSLGAIAINEKTNMTYVLDIENLYSNGSFYKMSYRMLVIDNNSDKIVWVVTFDTAPVYLAVNSNTNMIYISDGIGNIYVVSGLTNKIISTISLGHEISSLAINPNINLVYAGHYDTKSISVIDGSKNIVVATIDLKGHPKKIVPNLLYNQVLYVLVSVDGYHNDVPYHNYISLITVYDQKIVKTIQVNDGASDIDLNLNPYQVYVLSHPISTNGDSYLSVMDPGLNNTVSTVRMEGTYQYQIFTNQNLNRIYLLNEGVKPSISVVDGSTNKIIGNIPLQDPVPYHLAINHLTNMIYVTHANSHFMTILNGFDNALSEPLTTQYEIASPPTTSPVTTTNTIPSESIVTSSGLENPPSPLKNDLFQRSASFLNGPEGIASSAVIIIAELATVMFVMTYLLLLVEYLVRKKLSSEGETREKVNMRLQWILGSIPSGITPFIALYRINKAGVGFLVLLIYLFSAMLIPLMMYSFSLPPLLQGILYLATFFICVSLVSGYLVKRWSLKYNGKIDPSLSVTPKPQIRTSEPIGGYVVLRKTSLKKRGLTFLIFAGIFLAAFVIGTQWPLSDEESKSAIKEFYEQVHGIQALGIFVNNTTIALPMFIPGFGIAWGLFSSWESGIVAGSLFTTLPIFRMIAPSIFLSPIGPMELGAYSIAMSRSLLLMWKLMKRQSLKDDLRWILLEIAIVVGLLLAGGFIEYAMISPFGSYPKLPSP